MFEKNICPICGNKATISPQNDWSRFTDCSNCGRYNLPLSILEDNFQISSTKRFDKQHLAVYLYYNSLSLNEPPYYFISNEEAFKEHHKNNPSSRSLTIEQVENWYPRKFSEKIDTILLGFAKKSLYIGYEIAYTFSEMEITMMVDKEGKSGNKFPEGSGEQQIVIILEYLKSNDYIYYSKNEIRYFVKVNPIGWKRIDDLVKTNIANKNVFVSMAFNCKTESTRDAIKRGIIKAGFSPEFIDEIIHNQQIVPEMFRLIRESRFLILDISDPNYGAYYEAGYALGLGKEVIICCSNEMFNNKFDKTEEEKNYAKYLKPHFDIAQKQILVWNDYSDLEKKLSEWIKAIIG